MLANLSSPQANLLCSVGKVHSLHSHREEAPGDLERRKTGLAVGCKPSTSVDTAQAKTSRVHAIFAETHPREVLAVMPLDPRQGQY